jgi:FixJ family two-component response regulator
MYDYQILMVFTVCLKAIFPQVPITNDGYADVSTAVKAINGAADYISKPLIQRKFCW